ncbi:MAG TPA: VWA domain-containing protein, partial [Pyrinomonadaceae bacterium]|nr:VWA domain-containing protein [Pyrinomonadaceae bacterium]
MKYHGIKIPFLILSLAIAVFGQQVSPSPVLPKDDDIVVKITSELVQLDAVVTDKDGNQVTNLTRDDFEVLQDGKPQKIVGFSYVDTMPSAGPAASDKTAVKGSVVPPPVRTGAAGRIITFVVDDGNCRATQTGMFQSRAALEKFINEQMQPNDLVSIYRTRAGSSVLQQYSSDKQQLLRAARSVRWYPPTGGCPASDGSMFEAGRSNTFDSVTPGAIKTTTIESDAERKIRESSEDFGGNNQVVGTIGVLRYAVRGLERSGGRKIVFFLSDGMPFRSRDGRVLSAVDTLRDLTDLANRSSVIFNTIDVRGVINTSMIDAGDEVSTIGESNVNASDRLISDRSRDVRLSHEGMDVLARETGGHFYYGKNSLADQIRRALSTEKGYYLVAYDPGDESFKGKNFNKIEINVKRPGLKVTSRAGFVGTKPSTTATAKRSGDSELYEAIAAPLPRPGLNMQLTSYFGNTATEGNFVRSLFHLEGDEIQFVDDNGLK